MLMRITYNCLKVFAIYTICFSPSFLFFSHPGINPEEQTPENITNGHFEDEETDAQGYSAPRARGSNPELFFFFNYTILSLMGFLGGSVVKNSSANAEDSGDPGFDPWIGRIPWRRKWQPTPVFLPGKAHGQKEPSGLQFGWWPRVFKKKKKIGTLDKSSPHGRYTKYQSESQQGWCVLLTSLPW